MQPPIIVSHSEVQTYLMCQQQHWYGYGERIEKIKRGPSIERGIDGHLLLQIFFSAYMDLQKIKHDDPYKGAIGAVSDFVNPLLNDAFTNNDGDETKRIVALHALVLGFLDYIKSDILKWQIIGVEKEFRIKLTDDIIYAFTVDLLVWDGFFKPIDWKFTYDFFSPEVLALLPQVRKYIGALKHLDFPVDFGYYGILRYRSLKKNTPDDLYRLQKVEPTKSSINTYFGDTVKIAKQIAKLKAMSPEGWKDEIVRNSSITTCKMCDFRFLCGPELHGSDGVNIRNVHYKQSTYGYR